jgi:hypothetical protein
MKNAVFWDVTPCGSFKNQRFGGMQRINHQVDKNLRARNVSSNLEPKHCSRFLQEPRGVTSQKTAFFIITPVKTSNLTIHSKIPAYKQCAARPHCGSCKHGNERPRVSEQMIGLPEEMRRGVISLTACHGNHGEEIGCIRLYGAERYARCHQLCSRRFITAFTRADHLSLSWARPIQSTPPHPTSL